MQEIVESYEVEVLDRKRYRNLLETGSRVDVRSVESVGNDIVPQESRCVERIPCRRPEEGEERDEVRVSIRTFPSESYRLTENLDVATGVAHVRGRGVWDQCHGIDWQRKAFEEGHMHRFRAPFIDPWALRP